MLYKKGLYIFCVFCLLLPITSKYINELLGIRSYVIIKFFILILFLIFLFEKKLDQKITLKFKRYYLYLILYNIYLFVYAHYNGKVDETGYFILFNNWLHNLHLLLFLIILDNTIISKSLIRINIKLINYTILFAFIVMLIQIIFDSDFYSSAKSYYNSLGVSDLVLRETGFYTVRRQSIFGFINLNEIGLSFFPLLCGYYWINKNYILNNKYRLLIFLLIIAVMAIGNNSRYNMVSFLIICYMVITDKSVSVKTKVKLYIKVFILSLFIIAIILPILGYNLTEYIDQRLFVEESFEQNSRVFAFQNFYSLFQDNPWFGLGKRRSDQVMELVSGRSSQLHVGYLSHLVAYGFIGSFFLFMFWFYLLKDFYKVARHSQNWGAFYSILIFLWANLTLVDFSMIRYGILISIIFHYFSLQQYRRSYEETTKTIIAQIK